MHRDTPPDATRRLQPHDDPPVGANESLRDAIATRYPGPLGDLLYAAEVETRRKLVEKGRDLQARLSVLREAADLRRAEGEALLVPLHAAMEAAREAWEAACATYDRQRIANQSSGVGLNNEMAQIIAELNRSAFADRVKDWSTPDWYSPDPSAPRPLLEWTTHEGKKGV